MSRRPGPRGRRGEDRQAVTSQLPGAVLRAALVASAILAPSALAGDAASGGGDAALLIALFAALLTFAEYAARAPALVEFRAAPPVNRIRFATLALTLLALALALGAAHGGGSSLARLLLAVGLVTGHAVDVWGSPVRAALAALPAGADPAEARALTAAVGLAYLVALAGLAVLAIALRLSAWPRGAEAFNLWVNLPTFAAGGGAGHEVVRRLRRDGAVNLLLGIALPYLAPPIAAWAGGAAGLGAGRGELATVWMVTLWAFLPVSLLMRGIVLRRLAAMLELRLRRLGVDGADADPAFLPA